MKFFRQCRWSLLRRLIPSTWKLKVPVSDLWTRKCRSTAFFYFPPLHNPTISSFFFQKKPCKIRTKNFSRQLKIIIKKNLNIILCWAICIYVSISNNEIFFNLIPKFKIEFFTYQLYKIEVKTREGKSSN